MKEQIVITGATGLIGSQLTKELVKKYKLILLTRNPDKYTNSESVEYLYWDGKTAIPHILENSFAIINLIGENIGNKRWTAKQKQLILSSRKDAAIAISESIKACSIKPKVWVQASATGIYGQQADIVFNESSPKNKNSFLADVCREWESPITELETTEVRKVIIRTGVVLSANSDLWKQLNMPFTFGIAAIVGNGKQYLPWIHIEDEVNAILFTLEHDNCSGVFNLAAPVASRMREVISAIKSFRLNILTIHIPAWFLKLLFGKEKTEQLVLTNQHVLPKRLIDKGFTFRHNSIEEAVDNLLNTKS